MKARGLGPHNLRIFVTTTTLHVGFLQGVAMRSVVVDGSSPFFQQGLGTWYNIVVSSVI